ncbi:MAG TPA: RecQ family ATP-dependent DNA helicase [Pseudonocardia sp.]|jgi:ATP-dependent DNA helicase RecQ|uniref:RecQ family ATP-dependent DNA helicase n=1 Tax=Pseudonocardia sp. TaxID=60912 RepID=UPI002B4AC595|nr:RecQ family ATP-dependent DNA helicase [Pseudonocardia sp.]HLU55173.1 RecQ family ATP-dependent DNA helicase [Pseudonocardia sp.]
MTPTVTSDLRERAEAVLATLAGDGARLREDQWRAIHALVAERRRALVVQRTGWGKSAVYFVATALLRAGTPTHPPAGPTVIVSPLLALMRNQIEAAARAGIHAATVNSANTADWERTYAAVADGEVDVLLVSPERLNNPDFRDRVLPRLTETAGMLVVDEAHCVSDWGHDFRPDYRRLRQLIAELPAGIPVLATTATANDRVVVDVTEQLGLASGEPLVLRGSLDRESLRLSVVSLPTPAQRLGWLADHLDALPGAGIVYTLTVAAAEQVADFLRERGHLVASYTGKTDPGERLAAEADLLDNKVKALVATSALGMGFDKPDLGFVVHLGAPASPVAYYQQIGRAGRAVERAEVVLLPGREDRDIWAYFASLAFPPEPLVRQTLAVLGEEPLSTAAVETRVDLSRTRLEMLLKVLDSDGAVRRVKGGWVATGEEWVYDRERHQRIAQARRAEQQAMLDYIDTTGCRMLFLRRQLDDPAAEPCGRCDNCTTPTWSTEVDADAARAAQERISRPGVEVAPRKQWPSGMAELGVPASGRIPAGELAEPGRVIGRLSDIGWGARLRELLEGEDAPVPGDVLDACVRVLAGWGWAERPVGVVGIGSRTRPHQLAHLARRIAEIGRLPLLGTLAPAGPRPAGHANSAQRLAAVWSALEPPAFEVPDGPVLLVDDVIDSGWTATVAARALRRAGASAVLPFALAQRG